MPAYQLSPEELLEYLREQVAFLEASAASFDDGFEGEAKRLATVIRVLLHDTRRSTPLLQQLSLKDTIRYLDTAEPINPRNLLPTPGLVVMRVESGRGANYVAPLRDRPVAHGPSAKQFEPWWTDAVTKDSDSALFTRRDYVLTLSNKEGGAHVDPKLNAAYAALSRNNSLGFQYFDDSLAEGKPLENNPALASVRQIAHEVILSLRGQLTPLLDPNAEAAAVDLPAGLLADIGRNTPCPCGSGLKAKKCHLR